MRKSASNVQGRFVWLLAAWASAIVGCELRDADAEGIRLNPAVKPLALEVDPDPRAAIGQRYIVTLRDAARGANAVHAAGAQVALSLPQRNALAAYIPERALNGLRSNPNVESIEPDPIRKPLSETVPYGVPMVQADQVADAAQTGNVTVCIIDSGYYSSHEDLSANQSVTASTDTNGTGDPWVDGCGHGTHVAGTIAAVGNNDTGVVGVNPAGQLKLHIVKVFGNDCAWAYSSTLVKALDECRSHATSKLVVSMSLGGPTKNVFEENAFKDADAAGVLSVAAAGNDGNNRKSYPASYASVVSVAAIDSNKQVASFSQYNSAVALAAPGVGVLSTVPWKSLSNVSAGGSTFTASLVEGAPQTSATGVTGALLEGGLCSTALSAAGKVVHCLRGDISFYDKVMNAQSGGAIAVVISNNVAGSLSATLGAGSSSTIPVVGVSLADGTTLTALAGTSATVVANITTPESGYEAWDGTSMATPHVSGVAALVWNNVPTATNAQLRSALFATAEDLGAAGRDVYYGYGLLRAKAALTQLQGSGGTTCTITQSPETSCSDGLDNDCDALTDAADPSCQSGTCNLGQLGAACTVNGDCCSNNCKGKSGSKTCK